MSESRPVLAVPLLVGLGVFALASLGLAVWRIATGRTPWQRLNALEERVTALENRK